jgi:hypothetical protein
VKEICESETDPLIPFSFGLREKINNSYICYKYCLSCLDVNELIHVYVMMLFIVPTVPSDLKARAMTPGELHVTWNPPNQPNGNVTHYEVYWRRRDGAVSYIFIGFLSR